LIWVHNGIPHHIHSPLTLDSFKKFNASLLKVLHQVELLATGLLVAQPLNAAFCKALRSFAAAQDK
jgi:hypothetical protein